MREFLFENIADLFSVGPVALVKSALATTPVAGVTLRRNDELDLILELRSRGHRKDNPERFPAGTVRRADEEIEFAHAAGWKSIARGVIEGTRRSGSTAAGEYETVETYSAQSVELDFQRQIQSSYVVEWILNVPDEFIWTEPVRFSGVETLTKAVGSGDSEICMTASSKSGGGNQALHLRVSGIDLYVMRSSDRGTSDKRKPGQIVYRGGLDQTFRDKVRACLSFILGKPIVYLGHTEYCSEWTPTFIRSVGGFTINGAVFRLHDQPPFPINQPRYANMIDQRHVGILVNALFEKFEAIKFNELSWCYWYAMSSPVHAAAIHFGSLIEQLQNNSNKVIEVRKSVLEAHAWKGLNGVIQQWLRAASIDPALRKILEGKVAGLNQAPQGLVLTRLLETMGLGIGEAEIQAWKHRNMAAHGGISDRPEVIILNSKILRLLFHRMLAGITYCSDRYIDYYNLGHPVRAIGEAVPVR
jgi:hypothetical protein